MEPRAFITLLEMEPHGTLEPQEYSRALELARQSNGYFQRFVDSLASELNIRYQNLDPEPQQQLARIFQQENSSLSAPERSAAYTRSSVPSQPPVR